MKPKQIKAWAVVKHGNIKNTTEGLMMFGAKDKLSAEEYCDSYNSLPAEYPSENLQIIPVLITPLKTKKNKQK